MTDREIITALEEQGIEKDIALTASASRKKTWRSIALFIHCSWQTIQNARGKKHPGLGRAYSQLLRIYAREQGVIK